MAKVCIFAKTDILSVLSLINREYSNIYNTQTPKNIRLMKAYAKMAIIALGGWIEDGMKDLTYISADNLSKQESLKKLLEMSERINGFSYKCHISTSIVHSFGVHGLEFIETEIGDQDIARLTSALGNLKHWRDEAAHSYAAVIPCNPSMVINELNKIFPILKKMEKSARLYRDTHF